MDVASFPLAASSATFNIVFRVVDVNGDASKWLRCLNVRGAPPAQAVHSSLPQVGVIAGSEGRAACFPTSYCLCLVTACDSQLGHPESFPTWAVFHKDTGLDVPQRVFLSCHGLAQVASPF